MRQRQKEIIAELGSKPSINPEHEIAKRSDFLAQYLGQSGMHGFVLGISGGQDSLLAGLLAQQAVLQQREAGFNASFHAVLLPYGAQTDRDDALLALETIRPDHTHDLNIKPATDMVVQEFNRLEADPLSDFNKGNVKARMRMIAQYALAGQHGILVIGTDHAAEALTGFFTKFGDGGADILPLSGLTKRQGRQMLDHLGTPRQFMQKPPTADLLDHAPNQPDEKELALSYDTIDDYLEGKPVSERDASSIEVRYLATTHKRALPVSYGSSGA
jgi:NAD+ synthase